MRKVVVSILLYLLLHINVLHAQDAYLTVSGRVEDVEDAEPLPFASIGLLGLSLGTIANTQGEFDFHFPVTEREGQLVISMLGYEDFVQKLRDLDLTKENVFALKKEATMLREVVIIDSLSGGDILRIALNRIERNYPMEPYSMDGFYRDVKKVDNEYISILEAALKIYDKDYSSPRNPMKLRERVSLIEVRKSLNYEYAYKKYFDQYNLLEELLLANNIKYRSFTNELLFYHNVKRKGITQIGGHPLYELLLEGDYGYFLNMFIDTETFGVYKMIYYYGDGTVPIQEINRSGKRQEQMMRMEKIIEFKEYDGKLYLKYLKVTASYNWINRDTGALEAQTELSQMLMVNQVNLTNPEWVSTGKKMKKYGLQYQDMPYNQEFWDNYNVIKDTPLDIKIVEDLEKYGELSSQFQDQ